MRRSPLNGATGDFGSVLNAITTFAPLKAVAPSAAHRFELADRKLYEGRDSVTGGETRTGIVFFPAKHITDLNKCG